MNKYILIHIILSSLYSLILFKTDIKEKFYKSIVVLFIPILGIVYIILLKVIERFNYKFKAKKQDYNYEDRDEFYNIERNVEYSNAINIVPIEEALLLNENHVKRALIIDILKENPFEHIKALKKALDDDDSETAHYAASALSEIRSKFYVEIQRASVNYENNKNDLSRVKAYVDILKEYIESSLIDKSNLLKYKYALSLALEDLLKLDKSYKNYYIDKLNCDLELGELMKVKEYCLEFSNEYPEDEWTYIMKMKFFYAIYDNKSFYSTLNDLKESNIKLSNEALNIIRFWIEGE